FTLHGPLDHGAAGEDVLGLGFDIIATDGDGDQARATININVVDDVPVADLKVYGGRVIVDESGGVQAGTPSAQEISYFNRYVTNKGKDEDFDDGPIYGRGTFALTKDALAGADGFKHAPELKLEIAGNALSSGLFTTEGYSISLVEENGMIVGRVDDALAGEMQGDAAFALRFVDNRVVVAQYLSLKHNDASDPDDVLNLAGKVNLVYHITDGDDDVAKASANIGACIRFKDDGPTAENILLTFDDDDVSGADGNPGGFGDDYASALTGHLLVDYGVDGKGQLLFASHQDLPEGFTGKLEGQIYTLYQNGVAVLEASLNQDGQYNFKQLAPLQHEAGGQENNLVVKLKYFVQDGDQDCDAGYISIDFDDDTPIRAYNTLVDAKEDTAAYAIAEGSLNGDFGADGKGDIAFSWSETSPSQGWSYRLDEFGNMHISQHGVHVLTATLDPVSGAYELMQIRPLEHGGADSLHLTLFYNTHDGDGDCASQCITFNIQDDGPTGGKPVCIVVDEDNLPDGSSPDSDATTVSKALSIDWGQDGPAAIKPLVFDVVDGEQNGLSSGGVPVYYVISDDGALLTATAGDGGATIFTLELDSTGSGAFTFQQFGSLDHSDAQGENLIGLNFTVIATDSDGGTARTAIKVDVVDDVPMAHDDGTHAITSGQTHVINLLDNDEFGADGLERIELIDAPNGAQLVNGQLHYTAPDVDSSTSQQISYRIIDKDGDISEASLSFNIEPVVVDNKPPQLTLAGSNQIENIRDEFNSKEFNNWQEYVDPAKRHDGSKNWSKDGQGDDNWHSNSTGNIRIDDGYLKVDAMDGDGPSTTLFTHRLAPTSVRDGAQLSFDYAHNGTDSSFEIRLSKHANYDANNNPGANAGDFVIKLPAYTGNGLKHFTLDITPDMFKNFQGDNLYIRIVEHGQGGESLTLDNIDIEWGHKGQVGDQINYVDGGVAITTDANITDPDGDAIKSVQLKVNSGAGTLEYRGAGAFQLSLANGVYTLTAIDGSAAPAEDFEAALEAVFFVADNASSNQQASLSITVSDEKDNTSAPVDVEFNFDGYKAAGVGGHSNIGSDNPAGSDGNDKLVASNTETDDIILGQQGDDIIKGRRGDDELHGQQGNDQIFGGQGKDLIYGGDGDDTIRGGQGDDSLISGRGFDNVYGGTGADTFIFRGLEADGSISGVDTIHDYSFEEGDQLDISALLQQAFGDNPTLAEVESFVKIENQTLYVDVDGQDGDWQAVAVIDDYLATDSLRIILDEDGSSIDLQQNSMMIV
ncbi:DUF5801 repeats-in-toxin domain-containing protein, partial [Polycladidibacter stylochi]|uniref:T1SS-143 repeat domain-containing protein n=1 Tax=Polycladidibacter stylochi TaxID=1807766 RepID=UPI000A5B551F